MTPHDGPSHDLVHRAVGALVGAATGDALGAPFEFRAPGAYSARFPAPVLGGIGEIGGGGCGWAPASSPTTPTNGLACVRSQPPTMREPSP